MSPRLALVMLVALVAPLSAWAQPALPPARAITDLKSVAGPWDGLAISTTVPSGSFVWTIREDGSYDVTPPGLTGTIRVGDGKLLFRGDLTGRTGTLTLHEGGGQRVLRGASDDGALTFELRPAGAAARPPAPAASAAPASLRRVGVLALATRAAEAGSMRPLWQSLGERGWVPGQNLVIEYRSAEGKLDRLPALAAELVNLKVDLVIATCGPQVVAIQQASSAMPVISVCPDFVAAGMATNLARPGRNITGVGMLGRELIAKRLEVLKAATPKVSRVAFLWRAVYDRRFFAQEMEEGAQRLGLKLLPAFEVRGPEDFAGAFVAMARDRADAVVVPGDPLTYLHQKQIIELASKHRLPAIFDLREFAEAGGFLSYGPTTSEILGRVAGLTDKILKGAKPADLPVEQPTKFELVVNLKTAKALGLTIPASVLLRADHVIE